jgi:hypothetical protein
MTVGQAPATDSPAFRGRRAAVQIHPRVHIVSPEGVSIGDSVIIDDFVSSWGNLGERRRVGPTNLHGDVVAAHGEPLLPETFSSY